MLSVVCPLVYISGLLSTLEELLSYFFYFLQLLSCSCSCCVALALRQHSPYTWRSRETWLGGLLQRQAVPARREVKQICFPAWYASASCLVSHRSKMFSPAVDALKPSMPPVKQQFMSVITAMLCTFAQTQRAAGVASSAVQLLCAQSRSASCSQKEPGQPSLVRYVVQHKFVVPLIPRGVY